MANFSLSNVVVKVDGQALADELRTNLMLVEVDLSINLPGMFVLDFFDPSMSLFDGTTLQVGKTVVVSLETDRVGESANSSGQLIKGSITALEPVFDVQDATRWRVRGYDDSHRLHRQQKVRTFVNASDSDIVRQIASDNGLSPRITSTNIVHDAVYQFNQTDFDFIRERALRVGFICAFVDSKLYFGPASGVGGDGPSLRYGDALHFFSPRLSTSGQAKEVSVRGWDRKAKQAIVGVASSPAFNFRAGESATGGATAVRAHFGGESLHFYNVPVDTQGEAEKIAASMLDNRESLYLQGEGTCDGDPRIRAGHSLTLDGLGTKFNGKYFVTRAAHRLNRRGYETDISLAGLRGDSLADLIGSGSGAPSERAHRSYGVLPAVVTNNGDPEKLGRVKVKYPSVSDEQESGWVPVAVPRSGKQMGFWLIPNVDDEVLVAFEQGEFNRPYVIGSLWNGKDAPPSDGTNAQNAHDVHELLTLKGSKFLIDDSSGNEVILLTTSDGFSLRLDKSKKQVELTEPGGMKVTLDGAAKSMTLEGATQVNVKAQGSVKVESSGTVDVSGSGPVNIKGAIVNIN
ncbi:MAG: VgrG-related protein [Dehalococcoidia bacterium]